MGHLIIQLQLTQNLIMPDDIFALLGWIASRGSTLFWRMSPGVATSGEPPGQKKTHSGSFIQKDTLGQLSCFEWLDSMEPGSVESKWSGSSPSTKGLI
jgi:hypothetical protein